MELKHKFHGYRTGTELLISNFLLILKFSNNFNVLNNWVNMDGT